MARSNASDYVMNGRLREYLSEIKIGRRDFDALRKFAEDTYMDVGTIRHAYDDDANVGPTVQARLYVFTDDSRFGPRNPREENALKTWRENIERLKGVPKKKEMLAKPDRFVFNRIVVELLERYQIGITGRMQRQDLCDYIHISKTTLYNLTRSRVALIGESKVKFFLAFDDPRLAPTTKHERGLLKKLRNVITEPLSFVTKSPPVVKKTSPVKKSIFLQNIGNKTVVEELLGDNEFLATLTSLVAKKLQSGVSTDVVTVDTSESGIAGKTEQLLDQLTHSIDVILDLADNENREAQLQLAEIVRRTEEKFAELYLRVRALGKTRTGQAALHIIRQERKFLKTFEPKKT